MTVGQDGNMVGDIKAIEAARETPGKADPSPLHSGSKTERQADIL